MEFVESKNRLTENMGGEDVHSCINSEMEEQNFQNGGFHPSADLSHSKNRTTGNL